MTGAAGFVGAHLTARLTASTPSAELFGVVRPGTRCGPGWPEGAASLVADIEDPAAVDAVVAAARPERVYHLAAQSSPADSWKDPGATLRVNILGFAHLLEALRRHAPQARVLVVGSAEEYGVVPEASQPVTEETPLRPVSPYAVSKVSQGYLALQYALSHRMASVRTRTFNHTGPGRGEGFAESSFARQIAEIEKGFRAPELQVGNLDAVRDFSDVRDVVVAYEALLEKGAPGEVYNVCSGRGVRIGAILDALLSLSTARIAIRVDPERLRPADVPSLVGDPTRLFDATGWRPRIPLEDTLRDLLDYWRERVSPPSSASARA